MHEDKWAHEEDEGFAINLTNVLAESIFYVLLRISNESLVHTEFFISFIVFGLSAMQRSAVQGIRPRVSKTHDPAHWALSLPLRGFL